MAADHFKNSDKYKAKHKNNQLSRGMIRAIHVGFTDALKSKERWALKLGAEMLFPKAKPETIQGTLDAHLLQAKIDEAEVMRQELEQIKSLMKEKGIKI